MTNQVRGTSNEAGLSRAKAVLVQLVGVAGLVGLAGCGPKAGAESGAAQAPVDTVWYPTPPAPERLAELSLADLIPLLPPVWIERGTIGGEQALHPVTEEVRDRLRGGERMSDELWRHALVDTGVLRVPRRWPQDLPFAVSMTAPEWLGMARVIVDPRGGRLGAPRCGSLLPEICGTGYFWGLEDATYQELGDLALGRHEIPCEVTVRGGFNGDALEQASRADREDDGKVDCAAWDYPLLWEGTLDLSVEVVASLDEAWTPVSTPEVDAAVSEAVSLRIAERGPGYSDAFAWIRCEPDTELHPELRGLGLALVAELLEDGEVVATNRLPRHPRQSAWSSERDRFGTPSLEDPLGPVPGALARRGAGADGWSLRLRGTSEMIETQWHADRYWSGTVEVSLTDAMKRGAGR
ncbi:hypothetical protein [Engelhardtia mirabilis]|uniref:Uncharacterized protein n=1 Tax=Engelhardtia mirabilis TaxID=2528011 RepID=A0A518BKX9_9BACT|nr:hypothetical protein Pla133_27150 [Planctomycetes bacterium Pla133]QDV01953.1 hypothetical protein Pla86_27140 [Planctomycetes bacterium Pla86]